MAARDPARFGLGGVLDRVVAEPGTPSAKQQPGFAFDRTPSVDQSARRAGVFAAKPLGAPG
jgi:hypothetical protein